MHPQNKSSKQVTQVRLAKLGKEIPVHRAEKQCFQKKLFMTKNKARDWGIHMQKTYGGALQAPYKCPVCGNYHLTSQTPEETAEVRAAKATVRRKARDANIDT